MQELTSLQHEQTLFYFNYVLGNNFQVTFNDATDSLEWLPKSHRVVFSSLYELNVTRSFDSYD